MVRGAGCCRDVVNGAECCRDVVKGLFVAGEETLVSAQKGLRLVQA